jgi:hypothetical protein
MQTLMLAQHMEAVSTKLQMFMMREEKGRQK